MQGQDPTPRHPTVSPQHCVVEDRKWETGPNEAELRLCSTSAPGASASAGTRLPGQHDGIITTARTTALAIICLHLCLRFIPE